MTTTSIACAPQQLELVFIGERPARADRLDARRQNVGLRRLDAAQHIEMVRRRLNGASSFRPVVSKTRFGSSPSAAAASSRSATMIQRSPASGIQGGRRMASSLTPVQSSCLDGVPLHLGGKRVGGVDQDVDAVHGEIARQPVRAAEPAASQLASSLRPGAGCGRRATASPS